MSYASEINCMSPYSIPLWTILTKFPAPPGPTYIVQGPVLIWAFFWKKKVSFCLSPRFRSASTSHFSLDTPKTLLTVVHLRRHLGQHGLHGIKRCPVPSRHHRRAVARPLFSPRHSHADVANALLRDLSRAPLGVLVPLVPSVDDDVARLEARIKQPGNGAVDGGSGLDKDDDAAGYGERFFFRCCFFRF